MLATLRAQAVMLQGIWFIQTAQILFKGGQHPAALQRCRPAKTAPPHAVRLPAKLVVAGFSGL